MSIKNSPNIFQGKGLSLAFCLLYFLLFLALNLLFKDAQFWQYFSSLTNAEIQLCEYSTKDAVIRQPLNTLSNVFYLFYSIEIFILAFKDRKRKDLPPNLLIANYHYSLIYGICFFIIFLFSSLYHASLLNIFSKLDMVGVYASIVFPFFFTVHKMIAAIRYRNKPYFSWYGSVIMVLTFIATIYFLVTLWGGNEAYLVIPILSVLTIFMTLYHLVYYVRESEIWYMVIMLIATVIAILFYTLDTVFCNELSYMQLHSFWHLFSAISIFYFYLFLRSEKNKIFTIDD